MRSYCDEQQHGGSKKVSITTTAVIPRHKSSYPVQQLRTRVHHGPRGCARSVQCTTQAPPRWPLLARRTHKSTIASARPPSRPPEWLVAHPALGTMSFLASPNPAAARWGPPPHAEPRPGIGRARRKDRGAPVARTSSAAPGPPRAGESTSRPPQVFPPRRADVRH